MPCVVQYGKATSTYSTHVPTHPKCNFLVLQRCVAFHSFHKQLPYVSSNLVKSYTTLSPSPPTIKTKDSQAVCGEEKC